MKKVNTKTKVMALSAAVIMTTAIYYKSENITKAEQYAQITDNALELNVDKQDRDTVKISLSNFADLTKALQLSLKIEGNAVFKDDSIKWLAKSTAEDIKTEVKLSSDKKQISIFILANSNIEIDGGILEICEIDVSKEAVNSIEGYRIVPNIDSEGVSYNYLIDGTSKQVKGSDIVNTNSEKLTINTPPVISIVDSEKIVEGNISIRTGEVFNALDYVKVTDMEDGGITNIKVSGNVNNKKSGTYKVTYLATDSEGDSSTLEMTVLVEDSKQVISKPVINGLNKNVQIKQGESFNPLNGVTATDYLGRNLEIKVTGDYNVEVLGKYTLTYMVTDSYGNKVSEEITLEVIKQNAPIITGGNKSIQIRQGESFNPKEGVMATDSEGNEIEVKVSGDYDVKKVGSYLITYTATDRYGNTTTSTSTLTVITQDVPVISGAQEVIEIKVGEEFNPLANVVAKDYEANLVEIIVSGEYDINIAGEYSITYNSVDKFGNKAEEIKTLLRVIEKVEDNEIPDNEETPDSGEDNEVPGDNEIPDNKEETEKPDDKDDNETPKDDKDDSEISDKVEGTEIPDNKGENNSTINGEENNNSNSTTEEITNNSNTSKIPTTGAKVASYIIVAIGTVLIAIGGYIFNKKK